MRKLAILRCSLIHSSETDSFSAITSAENMFCLISFQFMEAIV